MLTLGLSDRAILAASEYPLFGTFTSSPKPTPVFGNIAHGIDAEMNSEWSVIRHNSNFVKSTFSREQFRAVSCTPDSERDSTSEEAPWLAGDQGSEIL